MCIKENYNVMVVLRKDQVTIETSGHPPGTMTILVKFNIIFSDFDLRVLQDE